MPVSRHTRPPYHGRRRRRVQMAFGKKVRTSTQRKALRERIAQNRRDLCLW